MHHQRLFIILLPGFSVIYKLKHIALLNPDMAESAAEASGVVLIDEIDMHLHPKWHWNIVKALEI